MENFARVMGLLFGSAGAYTYPKNIKVCMVYNNLYTYNLSEATNFHIREFALPTSCHMMQFKDMKTRKLAINWP